MSQFESPPPPPTAAGPYVPSGPPPYSGSAITGFVASLLGCTIIGALVGLIFGVLGIIATRGGRRRGMGLAIAAIPISLLFGVVGLGAAYVSYFGFGMVNFATTEVPKVLGSQAGSVDEAADQLLAICDPATRKKVDKARAVEWIKAVREKHGTLTSVAMDQQAAAPAPQTQADIPFPISAKFVNGPATVLIHFSPQSVFNLDFRITNLSVDNLSLVE